MNKVKKYLTLLFGVLIEAIGFSLFLEPNNLSATDVSGLSIIFERLYNVDISIFILISNLLLIVVSFIMLGKKNTINTIVGSLLLPLFISLTHPLSSIIDLSGIDMIVISVIGGVLMGVGNGIIFKSGFTSGGTDIIEDILCKYAHISLGKSIMLIDGFVVLCGGLAFGLEPMMYSILALATMSLFSTRKLIGIDEDKILMITTKNKKKMIKYITDNYSYGATIMDANGAYTHEESDFIMCSVSTRSYYKIKNSLKELDPKSFIVVLNSYETSYTDKDIRKKKKRRLS